MSLPRGTTDDPVQLLWTGGWDSSFRLIHLMHQSDAVVQPWYIIDEMRNSIGREVHAMRRIREALAERGFGARILTTRFIAREQISQDDEVSAQYRRLSERMRVGTQYGYLGRFAKSLGLTLELSMHDKDHGLGKAVYPHTEAVETPYGRVLRLKRDAPGHLELFRPYAFPLLGLSKLEMGREAKQQGYGQLLDLTWFCHTPRNGQPCGRCRPCQQVIQGRMHHRMPLTSQVLGQLRFWRRSIKSLFTGHHASKP
jgi:hypothetical protein